MSNVKKQVLTEIKEHGIKPTSRFYFVTKNYFFGLLFVVSVIVGAVSFSSILHELVLGSQFFRGTPLFMKPSWFITFVPLFWMLLLVIFTASAWFNFKRTDNAHKQENAIIVLASILFSLLLGLLLFKVGITQNLDYMMKSYFPTYRVTAEQRLERTAQYLHNRQIEDKAHAALLERERLRTLCFNQGRDNCFEKEFEEVKENDE